MNAYDYIINHVGLSAFDTVLLSIIFLLARAKYNQLAEATKTYHKRVDRIEKSIMIAGINLLPIEED